ncbi:MAG: hypothetical protein DI630_13065 [Gordonia sp. (in: high G+C Gram-positive bacteria)]|nr:MAG: hypothetical protein DI630_13065 [Gordonia sp. (in: high G+C Gram-positive bacteria)]
MLAAREAALTSIPVYVVPADAAETDDAERTRRRIIDQVIANEARADPKVSEKAAAVEQLSLTGLSATKIAKSRRRGETTVADADPEHLLAQVSARWHTAYVTVDGVQVEDHVIDWELDGDDDVTVTPEEGFHDPHTLTKTETCLARMGWFHRCREEVGLMRDWEWDQHHRSAKKSTPKDRPLTDEEQAHKDVEARARRKVITLNKLAVAAENVRRDKLHDMFGRKTLPKGKAAVFAAFLATTMLAQR